MAVREFNGGSDYVRLSVGGLATATYGTYAALYKVDDTATTRVLMAFLDSGTNFVWAPLVINDVDTLQWWATGDVSAPASPQGVWVLAVVRKATGTATPRYSIYNYDTTSWTHGNASGTMANGTAPTGGFINESTTGSNSEPFDGRLAVTAGWVNTVKWSADSTGDAQIEAAGLHTSLANWVTAAPSALWRWDVDVAAGITDEIGAADQVAISGTTKVTGDDPAGFSFGAAPPGPVTRVGVTTGAPAAATAFSPTLPTHAAGDRLILAVVGKDQTTTIPTINQGWTLVKSGTGGTGSTTADNGQTFWAIYAKDATSSSETAPTVTPGGTAPNSWEWICSSHRTDAAMEWRDAIGASVAWVQSASDTTTASPLTGTAGAWTGVQPTADDAIFVVGVIPTDLGSALGATTLTATGLSGGIKTTATSQYIDNGLGLDSGAVWAGWTGLVGTASAGLAVSFTVTGATNQSGSIIAIALRQQTVVTTTPVSSSVATSWNTEQAITATVAESWKVRQEITKIAAESWMTEFLVSQNVVQSWAVKQAVSKTTAEAWNLQGRITSSSAQAWNTRQAITGLSVQVWAVKQAITKTTAELWHVREVISKTVAELWNVLIVGLTAITSSYVAIWNVKTAISQSMVETWRVRQVITQSITESWPVEITASQSVAENWRVRQALTLSTGQQWAIKVIASQTVAESWRVRQAINSNSVQAWHVRNVVASTTGQAWAVKTSVIAEIGTFTDIYGDSYSGTTWRVRQAITKITAELWNVAGLLTTVTKSQATSWKVVGRINAVTAQQWAVRVVLSQSVAESWRVRGVLSQTVAESWRVRQAPTASFNQSWNVKATASQAIVESWRVRQAITRSLAELWNTIATGQVSKSQATAWHVRARATSPTAQQWAVKTTISKTTAETWRVAITASRTLAELWNVLALASVTSSRATSWKVRAYTSQTVDQAWNQRTATAQSLSEAWNVRTLATGTRATSWRLRGQLTASRAILWHVIGRITVNLLLTWNTHPESFYPGGPWTIDATQPGQSLEVEPDSGLIAVGDWTVTMEA